MAQSRSDLSGSITGLVLDADTLSPLSGVRVGSQEVGWVTTNTEGRYLLQGLTAGAKTIRATAGVLASNARPVNPIRVNVLPAQQASGVDFRVRLTATISGRVLDEAGEPLQNIRVIPVSRQYDRFPWDTSAYQYSFGDPTLSPEGIGLAITDDLGRYEVSVFAGRSYRVLAQMPSREVASVSETPQDPESRAQTLISAYYPGVTNFDSSVPVVVHSLATRESVDIRLSRSKNYCISGSVTAQGKATRLRFALAPEEIARIYSAAPTLWTIRGQTQSDGKFRVCDLHPGRYSLNVFQPRNRSAVPEFNGTLQIELVDRDIAGLAIDALPPTTRMNVETRWDVRNSVTMESPSIEVGINRRRISINRSNRMTVPADFSLEAVQGLAHDIVVLGLRPPFYVRDITYGGTSVLYKPLVPSGGGGVLRINLGNDAGTIAVQVTNAQGHPVSGALVAVIPTFVNDVSELASELVAGLTDESGAFTFNRIPPRPYHVLATDTPPPYLLSTDGALQIDPTVENLEILHRNRVFGERITLESSETERVNLTTRTLK